MYLKVTEPSQAAVIVFSTSISQWYAKIGAGDKVLVGERKSVMRKNMFWVRVCVRERVGVCVRERERERVCVRERWRAIETLWHFTLKNKWA